MNIQDLDVLLDYELRNLLDLQIEFTNQRPGVRRDRIRYLLGNSGADFAIGSPFMPREESIASREYRRKERESRFRVTIPYHPPLSLQATPNATFTI